MSYEKLNKSLLLLKHQYILKHGLENPFDAGVIAGINAALDTIQYCLILDSQESMQQEIQKDIERKLYETVTQHN